MRAQPARLPPPSCCPLNAAADCRERTILQWRVQRKRALRQTVERLAEALGPESSPEAAPRLEGAAGGEAAVVEDAEQQDAGVPAEGAEEQAEDVHEEL